ncbi:MAG: citrate:proton symporter [Rhodothermales bacterium]
MSALIGLFTIVALLAVIMTRRLSPLVALIVIPIAASLLGGHGLETGAFITNGIKNLAPVVAMFVFAILFFGVLTDAGLFDPVIGRMLRAVGARPAWIVPGTALLAALVHLDGSGAVTFLVVIPAMRPLYDALKLDRRLLAAAAAMGAGVMNMVPWGGPTIRAASALDVPVMEIYAPMLPAQAAGLLAMLGLCYYLGRREGRRLGIGDAVEPVSLPAIPDDAAALRRPGRFWINAALTVLVLGSMVSGKVPPAVSFMVGAALALTINYPDLALQRQRVDAHARAALMMASILLAAGVFTGVMQGSGMLTAMAEAAVGYVSPGLAVHIPVALGVISMPLSLLFDPDSFYFGVLPVVSGVSGLLGVPDAAVAQGALLGQMTTGFPVSPLTPATFLLVGLAGVELGDHQKFSIPLLWGLSLVMTAACIVFGIFKV